MRILWVAILSVALAGPAAAQCCGDCAGDGEVTINDLIVAVNNALGGCADVTPTVGPSETPTRAPTPTRTPVRCPRDFTDTNNQCVFNGRYNQGCGSAVDASFAVAGSTVTITVATGISNPAQVRFRAQRQSASRATLTGWSTNNFQTVNPTSGSVSLEDDGEQLIVFPNDPPFMIQGCNFVQYAGDYVRPRSASAAELAADAEAAANLRWWDEQPIPELEQ